MSVPKHLKEHTQLNIVDSPMAVLDGQFMLTGTSYKAFSLGAAPPFNATPEGIGEGVSMVPRFYPYVFPRPMYFELVNVGLSGNAATNADRLKLGFWNQNGSLLFERNLDFTAGTDDAYVTLPHDSSNPDVPASERNPLLPRCFMVGLFPELQSDASASATVSLATAATATGDFGIGLTAPFAAATEDPTTQAKATLGGMVMANGANMTRPAAYYNLNTDWPSLTGSGVNKLTWGYFFGASIGGYFPAIRVAGSWEK